MVEVLAEIEQRAMGRGRRFEDRLVGHADIVEARMAERRPGVAGDQQDEGQPAPPAHRRTQPFEQMPAAREIEDDAGIGHQRARGKPRLGGWKHQRDTVELDAIGIGLQDQRIVVGTCPSPDDQRVAERPEDRADHARDTAETKKREPTG